jgi:hypothetical protein
VADQKREWELKTAKDIAEALEWVRRRSKGRALVILAIGVNSIAYAKDSNVTPADAVQLVADQLPSLRDGLSRIDAQPEKTTRGSHTRRD